MDRTAREHARRDRADETGHGTNVPREGGESGDSQGDTQGDTQGDAAPQPSGAGREAIPPDTERPSHEHESGYGGKKDSPRVTSDQRPGT